MAEKVDIFMPLYVSDYLRDTSDLSLEENGAYCRLLFHLWVRQGTVRLDHDRLARVVGTDRRTWARIWPVLERFFHIEDGNITQRRLAKELERAMDRKLQGRSAAEARWSRSKNATRDARALPEHCPDGYSGHPEAGADTPAPAVPEQWTSPSPSPSEPTSESEPEPLPARDPGATSVEAAAPRPGVPRVTAQRILDMFGDLRSEIVEGALPWLSGQRNYAKAEALAKQLADHPEAVADIEPTMRLLLERVKDSQDKRDEDPSFVFGTWCSSLSALREEIHGTTRRSPVKARASPARDVTRGWAAPSGNYGKGAQKL